MHILVTGGCGYVGTVLTSSLLGEGHSVIVVDTMWFGNHLEAHDNLTVIKADIRDEKDLPMDGIEAVVHLANIANDPCSDLNPKLSWEVNVLSTMRLLECAVSHGVNQFVYASSGSVYGVSSEARVTEDLPLVPISDYNKTKMVSERVLLSYADRILVQCVRPATICGVSPRMRLDLSVNMLTMQALRRNKVTVFGGDQTRPNIHIKDMIRVYLHLLNAGDKAPGIYNAGCENMSIMEIAERITRFVPAEILVTESNDPRSYRLNSDKLRSTGFQFNYGVDDGIRDVMDAYNQGRITDHAQCYNLKVMKMLGPEELGE